MSYRPVGFSLGLLVSSAVVLCAFEWRTPVDRKIYACPELMPVNLMDQEIIPVHVLEKPAPKPPSARPLELVPDLEPIALEPTLTPLPDIGEEPILHIPPIEEVYIEDTIPKRSVSVMPLFPGGDEALLAHLARSIRYPAMARDAGVQGPVFLSFVVEKDGSVTQAKVLRGIGGGCDEEALRVIRELPRFSPGKQNGRAVRVLYTVPVRFTLK